MWIFMNDAMLSIVTDPRNPDQLTVRARAKGDIERVFDRARVFKTPLRDYAYRAYIPRRVVAAVLSKRIHDIDAANFKSSVRENDRHDAYADCWSAMMRFQTKRERADRGQGLYGQRSLQRRIWDDLASEAEDEDFGLDDSRLGMPHWEPRRKPEAVEDPDDAAAMAYMRERGWL